MEMTNSNNSCNNCPHKGHSGRYTPGGALEICNHDKACKDRGPNTIGTTELSDQEIFLLVGVHSNVKEMNMKVTIKKLCECFNKNVVVEPDPITEIEFETFEDEELETESEN